MNKFDKKIKEMAKAEHREVPECVRKAIDETLESLPESCCKIHSINYASRIISIAASFILVLFVIMPNVSPAYAEALHDVPVVGKLVQLVTIRNYRYSDGSYEMDIKVPEVQSENEAGAFINKDVNELTEALVSEFYKTVGVSQSEGYGAIYLDYNAVTDTPRWFTLKLSVSEVAADSHSYFKYYNVDREKGVIVELGDLFVSGDSMRVIADDIERQMSIRKAEDPEVIFWENESEFNSNPQILQSSHNFYWDKEGNLVIPFDKFEVGPGYIGTPEFVIEKNLIKDILKPEYSDIEG